MPIITENDCKYIALYAVNDIGIQVAGKKPNIFKKFNAHAAIDDQQIKASMKEMPVIAGQSYGGYIDSWGDRHDTKRSEIPKFFTSLKDAQTYALSQRKLGTLGKTEYCTVPQIAQVLIKSSNSSSLKQKQLNAVEQAVNANKRLRVLTEAIPITFYGLNVNSQHHSSYMCTYGKQLAAHQPNVGNKTFNLLTDLPKSLDGFNEPSYYDAFKSTPGTFEQLGLPGIIAAINKYKGPGKSHKKEASSLEGFINGKLADTSLSHSQKSAAVIAEIGNRLEAADEDQESFNPTGSYVILLDFSKHVLQWFANWSEENLQLVAEQIAEMQANVAAKAEVGRQALAQAEAEAKAQAETAEAEAKAQAEAETKAQAEAETKAQAEAETKAQAEAETKAQAEAEAKAQAETAETAEAEAKATEEETKRLTAEKATTDTGLDPNAAIKLATDAVELAKQATAAVAAASPSKKISDKSERTVFKFGKVTEEQQKAIQKLEDPSRKVNPPAKEETQSTTAGGHKSSFLQGRGGAPVPGRRRGRPARGGPDRGKALPNSQATAVKGSEQQPAQRSRQRPIPPPKTAPAQAPIRDRMRPN